MKVTTKTKRALTRAKSLRENGLACREIAKIMKKEGYTGRSGQPYSHAAINTMLWKHAKDNKPVNRTQVQAAVTEYQTKAVAVETKKTNIQTVLEMNVPPQVKSEMIFALLGF